MSARVERLLVPLVHAGLDALLVTDLVNVRYLTGYTGSNGVAVVGPRIRAFITDFRYVEQAAEEVDPSFERHRAPRELLEVVSETLPEGELRLGFEDANVTVRDHDRLRSRLADQVELSAAGSLVERLRAVKEPGEVDRMRAAAAIADEAFQRVIADGLVGRTEQEVARAIESEMVLLGASRPSFDTIVAAGPHGALPHAQCRDVEIRSGEIVVIDWGAQVDGYCSDCTRTLAAGGIDEEARAVYELVLGAQLTALDAVEPGVEAKALDGTARELIADAGHGSEFGHGLGHGVGLEVHETPTLSQRAQGELGAGNVLTVEPGVYLPGRFGVRIEDLVAVTAEGHEILTSVSKELTVTE